MKKYLPFVLVLSVALAGGAYFVKQHKVTQQRVIVAQKKAAARKANSKPRKMTRQERAKTYFKVSHKGKYKLMARGLHMDSVNPGNTAIGDYCPNGSTVNGAEILQQSSGSFYVYKDSGASNSGNGIWCVGTVAGQDFPHASIVAYNTSYPADTVGPVDGTWAGYGGNASMSSTEISSCTAPAPPTITDFNPKEGRSDQSHSVVIVGTNLTGATVVKLGTLDAASYVVDSATQISAMSAIGTVTSKVQVTTPGGTAFASPDPWRATAPPGAGGDMFLVLG